MPKLKRLSDQVIVITGASSGIGLCTARMAAAKGAKVVLAARNHEALQQAVSEIEADGGEALAVVADVGVKDQVQRIADAAIERFGGFDTWVNDAGVGIWGRLNEVSEEDARRLFDTNYWGVVHGSMIAARKLNVRGGGAIINLGSVASDVALPLQGMYSASKHAVKGFTDALRMELEEEGAPVSVTLIKPASIGTPMPEHFKNETGRKGQFPPPVYAPEEVARAILHAAVHRERDIRVGSASKAMGGMGKMTPRLFDRIGERFFAHAQLTDQPAGRTPGNLYKPGPGGQERGDANGHMIRPSYYTRARLHPAITGGALLAGVLAGAALMNRAAIARTVEGLRR
jgi:short-subunit dehydrogenase